MADTEPASEPPEGTEATPPTEPEAGDPPTEPAGSEINAATEKHLTDLRKENAGWRRKLRDAEKKIEELSAMSASDIEKARAEERQVTLTEAMADASKRIVRAEVIAAAAGKLHDPTDALGQLDVDDITLDDNGEVDRKALATLVDDLVKAKPYLAATRDPEFGNRTAAATPASPDAAMDAWLRASARR